MYVFCYLGKKKKRPRTVPIIPKHKRNLSDKNSSQSAKKSRTNKEKENEYKKENTQFLQIQNQHRNKRNLQDKNEPENKKSKNSRS